MLPQRLSEPVFSSQAKPDIQKNTFFCFDFILFCFLLKAYNYYQRLQGEGCGLVPSLEDLQSFCTTVLFYSFYPSVDL